MAYVATNNQSQVKWRFLNISCLRTARVQLRGLLWICNRSREVAELANR